MYAQLPWSRSSTLGKLCLYESDVQRNNIGRGSVWPLMIFVILLNYLSKVPALCQAPGERRETGLSPDLDVVLLLINNAVEDSI